MAKGMRKGSQFERSICKQLSEWWTDGERDDVFWRSAGSGARAKTRSKTGRGTFGQYGDVQATDPIGQPLIDLFTIEIKRGYGVTVLEAVDKPGTAAYQLWEKWLRQVIQDHENAGSVSWMLITKRDRKETMAAIPIRMVHRLINCGAEIHRCIPSAAIRFATSAETHTSHLHLFTCPLSSLLRRLSCDSVKEAATLERERHENARRQRDRMHR